MITNKSDLIRPWPFSFMKTILIMLGWVSFLSVPITAAPPVTETNSVTSRETPPENYRLSSNDLIQVKVYREADLDTRVRLNEDGTINFPLIGETKIGGLTVSEATELIRARLAQDYLVNPHVTVTVLEFAQRQFTILGQVRQPGIYALPANKNLDLLQALATAGGLTRIGNAHNIQVQRRENGQEIPYKLDSKDMQAGKAKPFVIQPGDVITVNESLF